MPKRTEPGLDRPTIVATALRLLDEVGLDGLTLRRLATELGVQAPALYWHVKNKQELLDLMSASMSAEIARPSAPAEGQTWADWLTEVAYLQRRILLAHRDGARLVAGTRPFESIFDTVEKVLASLVAVGFTPGQALRAATTLNLYVGGFVLEEQAEQRRWQEAGVVENDEAAFLHLKARGEWPLVVAAFAESGDPNGEQAFADGVETIIAGLGAMLAKGPPARPIEAAGPTSAEARPPA